MVAANFGRLLAQVGRLGLGVGGHLALSLHWLLPSADTITIDYYYSARKLVLVF